MSSVPPASSTTNPQAFPPGPVADSGSLSVRFGAETSQVNSDGETGCELALKMPILLGGEVEPLLSNGKISQQGDFTLLCTPEEHCAGFCVLSVEEDEIDSGAQQIYDSLFRILEASPQLHLYRIWNYVPFINQETGDMENYRHFNVGRWDAFRSRFGNHCNPNMPAASAVGIDEAKVVVAFLAGTQPVSYIENPEQVPAYDYPSTYGPRPPSFSRCALMRDGVSGTSTAYLSGTASVKGHATVASDCLESQLMTTVDNIGIIRHQLDVPSAGITTTWRAYVREPSSAEKTREVLCNSLPSCSPDNLTIVQADICRKPLRVEVEGIYKWHS